MRPRVFISLMAFLLIGCNAGEMETGATRERLAIEFLRGLYGGDPSVVDRLAAPEIVVSYPIFEEVLGAPSIQGRDAVREFATGFGRRWIDAEVTVHSVVSNDDAVVVLWGFRARPAGAGEGDARALPEREWGGITLYRFDSNDRVVLEVGEESEPGPAARVPSAFGEF